MEDKGVRKLDKRKKDKDNLNTYSCDGQATS